MENTTVSDEFRNRMLVHWAEVGDNPQEVWSKLRAEGFDVDIETVNNLLSGGPKTIYEEPEAGPTEKKSDDVEETGQPLFQSVVGVDNIASYCKRKVKLTDDILQLVSTTLEEDEVHSLLSLKRALEKKGVEISKTSVFRALEKLGRSIVEKKKKMNHPSGLRTPDSLVKPTAPRPKLKTGPRTVAEMLQSQGRNMTGKRTRIVIPRTLLPSDLPQPKKLRTLLPKPTVETSGPSTSSTVASTQVSAPLCQVTVPGALMQITQDNKATSSSSPAVVTPTILATPHVLKVTVSSPPSTSSSLNTVISTTVPSLTSPSALRGRTPTSAEQQKEEKQEQSSPIIKIEIDDPSYEEYTERKPSSSSKTMTTVTPPPRVTSQRPSDEYHVSERLTKSASPQLMTGSYESYTSQRIEDDAKSRANQQFRLNKAIGKIANLRSQAAVSRAPRKPSVVFHRPSSNSTPIPFKVRHDASFAKSQHREDIRPQPHPLSSHPNGRVPSQFQRVQGRSIPNKGHRSLQMMRAARNAQLRSLMRSGLYKLQPSALSNVRTVNAVNNRRRMAARMQRQEIVAPLYYPSELDEEDFLPELEIDPPDNYNVNEDIADHSEGRPEPQRNDSDNNQLLRDIFQEMTKEMRQLSQHMETIHGQLQVIIDRLPPAINNNQPKVSSPHHHHHTPSSNGNMETTSPLSNDEHSPDPLDDTDDNLGEGMNGQERPLDAVDFRELPLLGTPESDALIREVVDDGRWDQMTPYAGAPRLAIALARYCIFGTKVLIESSVTGRNSKNPLNHVSMRKIKELLKEKYGSRCNQLEFEMVWKTSRESISQLCKRLRRKFQMTGRVSGGQEDFILDCRQ